MIVDLACGTGNTAIPWGGARGRMVLGVDVSDAMLRVARKKSRRVRWMRQDLTRLALDVTADVATFNQLWFVKRGKLYRKVLGTVKTRSFEDAGLRRMLRVAGLRLEKIDVMRRMKGRPIRKLYVAVKPCESRASARVAARGHAAPQAAPGART